MDTIRDSPTASKQKYKQKLALLAAKDRKILQEFSKSFPETP